MKHLMADLEVEQEKCAGLAAALDGELSVDAGAVDSSRACCSALPATDARVSLLR